MLIRNSILALSLLISTKVSAQNLSALEKEAIFNNTKKLLTENYHFKKAVSPTINYLDKKWKSGSYKSFSTLPTFTDALSKDLKSAANDRHLNFFYMEPEIATGKEEAQNIPWFLMNEKFLNNGLTNVDILPGDIGYIKIGAFGAFERALGGAFAVVENTQALIIDLRGNGGGMPSNLVSAYLFPEDSIHLSTIFWNDRTDSLFTPRKLEGPRYLNKPVYLLTDKSTFSSAEAFVYDLKAMKRVTIIGEETGGGANPGGTLPVYTFPNGARLDLYVSLAHVENAITKTNWEGTGVYPDIKVNAEVALQKAQVLALEHLAKKEQNVFLRKKYEEIIRRIDSGK